MIYIRIFNFQLSYCSYNYHNCDTRARTPRLSLFRYWVRGPNRREQI